MELFFVLLVLLIACSRGAFAVAVAAMVLPMALGMALGWVFLPASDAFLEQCVFLGVALAITAVPATVRSLMDLGRLDSPSGRRFRVRSACAQSHRLLRDLHCHRRVSVPLGRPPHAGLFDAIPGTAPVVEHVFSALVVMAVVTTLVTPVLLKRIYGTMPA